MTPQQTISEPRVRTPRSSGRSIESVLEQRWAKVFLPSLLDLFFLAVLAWLFVGGQGWSGLLADGDAGWHIRTGEWILDHRSVPYQDLYSFSKAGSPWYAWEWLSDVIDAVLYRTAALKGVVLFAGVVIALYATTLMHRIMRRGVSTLIAMVVALFGVSSASIHFLARPHVFTLLFLSVAMWMLETVRDGKVPAKWLWLLVPMTLVWTNLHGGFLILVAVLGVAAVGSAIEEYVGERDWSRPILYASLSAACGAVSLVNPYGWGLHRHVLEYLRSDWIRNVIQEFQSPSFRGEVMLQFEALLFAGLITAGLLIRRRKVVEGLWILFFGYLSLSSVRHVPVFVTATVPLIAVEVAAWWQAATASASKSSILGIINQMAADTAAGFRRVSIWPVFAVIALIAIGAPIRWPKDFPEELFPVSIVHAHESEIRQSRLFTTDQWADYLIYRNPQQKVFIDGRSDFYGAGLGNEYIQLTNGAWRWREILNKYKFNAALIPVDVALAQLLKQSPEWRVVADDGKRILLVLTSPPVPATGIPRP